MRWLVKSDTASTRPTAVKREKKNVVCRQDANGYL
jgi:hypothetical protein